jgi:hypothetical protein
MPEDLPPFLVDDAAPANKLLRVERSWEGTLDFFAFFEIGAFEAVVVEEAAGVGSRVSGSSRLRYVSSKVDKAIDPTTQTTGVNVNIRRTMTPAK